MTRYYRAGRSPFLNLSDLGEPELSVVWTQLATPAHQAMSSRWFGPRFMALRRATELQARDLSIAAGGTPQRSSPHYFVLGSSDWFAGPYRDVAEVRLPLPALPPEALARRIPTASPLWVWAYRWPSRHPARTTPTGSTKSTNSRS
jgi:hypothetical protein